MRTSAGRAASDWPAGLPPLGAGSAWPATPITEPAALWSTCKPAPSGLGGVIGTASTPLSPQNADAAERGCHEMGGRAVLVVRIGSATGSVGG